MIVALPRAVPIPLPLIALGPMRLNLQRRVSAGCSVVLASDTHIGAFCNMSGTMKNRTILPLMYTWSSCDTRPSRPVTVMSLREMLRLSSAAYGGYTVNMVDQQSRVHRNVPSASFPL